MMRLQKFLAEAGIASRRAAEALITSSRVSVNGRIVTELGTKIDPNVDQVEFDGDPVRAKRRLYVALNKPPGYVCTRSDPENRRIVSDLLPKEWGHLHTIGRLDRASEGLLLLTNDGEFSLKVAHPRYGIRKVYQVIVTGFAEQTVADKLIKGVRHGGDYLKALRVQIYEANNTRSKLEIELAEGKNREVRRLLAACGFHVEALVRISIGRVKLGNLPSGKWRTLTEPEIKSLLPA
ncbi:pseudouridine synthase [bacterium]|nr:pseudouridine synthase [bacterium]